VWDCFIDIFDGGPTVTAATDAIRTVREAEWLRVAGPSDALPAQGDALPAQGDAATMILATGTYGDFVACYGKVVRTKNGELLIEPGTMDLLNVESGDLVLAVAR